MGLDRLDLGRHSVSAGGRNCTKRQWARWVGIITASLSLLLMFFWVFAYPIAAFTIMFIDMLVLYTSLLRVQQ